jgi:hypothetical protein
MYLVAKHLIYPVRSEHTEHYNVHSALFTHLVAEHLLHPVRSEHTEHYNVHSTSFAHLVALCTPKPRLSWMEESRPRLETQSAIPSNDGDHAEQTQSAIQPKNRNQGSRHFQQSHLPIEGLGLEGGLGAPGGAAVHRPQDGITNTHHPL